MKLIVFQKGRYKSFYNSSVMGMKIILELGPSSHGRVYKENFLLN